MKRIFFSALVLFIISGFSSCKQEYICTCTASGAVVTSTVIYAASSGKATTYCNDQGKSLGDTCVVSTN